MKSHQVVVLCALGLACNQQRGTQINKSCKPAAPVNLQLDGSEEQLASWHGGFVEYDSIKGYFADYPNFQAKFENTRCSALFDFAQDAQGTSVRILTSDTCIDKIPKSAKASLWVWRPPSGEQEGGYVQLALAETGQAALLAAVREAPGPVRRRAQDIYASGLAIPSFASFARAKFPDRVSELDRLCAHDPLHPERVDFDNPFPASCVWPQELKSAHFRLAPESSVSPQLVSEGTLMRQRREASTVPAADATAGVRSWVAEWEALQLSSVELQHWIFVKDTLLNKGWCEGDTTLRANCFTWAGKHLLPSHKAALDDLVSSGLAADKAQALMDQYGGIKNAWLAQVSSLLTRWSAAVAYAEQYKTELRVHANLPSERNAAELRQAWLFPSADHAVLTELQGVQWVFQNGQLHRTYSAAQQLLRRPLDTGAIVTLGDTPIFSLSRASQESEGAAMMPLPVPRPRVAGGAVASGPTGASQPTLTAGCP